jgi:CPA2 family monovalent cation:H+ antiporter-2
MPRGPDRLRFGRGADRIAPSMNALVPVAAAAVPPFLDEVVALVVASALIAFICHKLKVLPIVGFLIAGVAIGPNALGIVRDAQLIESVAEIGVVLLLFTLGIEFSLERLARIKRLIFIGGGLQMLLTVAATAAILAAAGVSWRAGIFTGCLVALSSTAIVLKVLDQANESTGLKGQLALGILIFQDLAIVALVLVVPMLGSGGGSLLDVARALGMAVGIIALVLVIARRVMPVILDHVARTCSQEIFLLTIIGICLGTAWLTSLAGVSLSLGAFLAGLVVSESRYSHHAFAEILPLQILFSAIFFVSVGLLLDVAFVIRHPMVVVGVVAAVVLLKVLTTGASALALRAPLGVTAGTAFLLAQIGEFSFVLERVGRASGVYPGGDAERGGQAFIASAVLLMVVTPLLARIGDAAARRTTMPPAEPERDVESTHADALSVENHVIVAGYGGAARYLTRVLRDSGIPFVIVTLSPTGAAEAERTGLTVIVGDYSRQMLLRLAGIERAKMLVIPDDAPAMARRVVAQARTLNPTLRIAVRTLSAADVESLTNEGADDVVVDQAEIGIQIFTRVLRTYQVSLEEIDDHVTTVRAGGYAALRTGISDVPIVVCGELDEECFDTRTFTVRAGSSAVGISVADFTSRTGVSPTTVDRGEDRIAPPEPVLIFQAGDRVTARASSSAFMSAGELLRGRESGDTIEPAGNARTIALTVQQSRACEHAAGVEREITTAAEGCEDCLRTGDRWTHLRMCMTCGGVRCCDSSPNKHATAHFHESGHPVMRSFEPREDWAWCYVDERVL